MSVGVGNDRAWNDPPPLPYLGCQTAGSKKTILNKRVGFPLHKPGDTCADAGKEASDRKATVESILSVVSYPPVESNSTLCNSPQSVEESIQNNATDEEMLSFILSSFNALISSFSQLPKEDIAGIKRKIDIFRNFWNGKLSDFVKQKMFQLATELSAGNVEVADKLHRSLVVSNIREVAPWMVGVKHIIQNTQKISGGNIPGGKESEEPEILDACTFHPDCGLNPVSS